MAPSVPESLAGVGTTAIGVALIRARETARGDRLYDDPYAQAFADAAEREFLDPASPEHADTWTAVRQLVDAFYEARTIGVRITDDLLREAVAVGCRQVVDLGAGLDTHAFRLDWPHPVHLFEVDLPAMFAFKEPVLRELGAVAGCGRSIVRADLRADWSAALPGLGFRDTVPTAWEAGVLGFLGRADAQRLVTVLTGLSAPGSRLTCPQMSAAAVADTVRSVRGVERVRDAATPGERGLGPDAPQWLRALGWHTEVRDFGALARTYGRPQPDGLDAGLVVATLG